MKNSLIYYSIGALLYCPADSQTIINSIITNALGTRYSLALCLEDTISDDCVADAQRTLVHSLKSLHVYREKNADLFYLPQIFIRVRRPSQISELMQELGDSRSLVQGFILPKITLDNADAYLEQIISSNKASDRTVYFMPILESPDIINPYTGPKVLNELKAKIDTVEDFILNIRVGGNDICHQFGIRRSSTDSIHSIAPVSHIFSNIMTAFGMDYVISGPVWEYYQGPGWDTGLIRESEEDRLCGLVGKTVIHPNQITLVNETYKVSKKDLDDAHSILNWDDTAKNLVSGSVSKERMNELKTHSNWALKILYLSQIYGVK